MLLPPLWVRLQIVRPQLPSPESPIFKEGVDTHSLKLSQRLVSIFRELRNPNIGEGMDTLCLKSD